MACNGGHVASKDLGPGIQFSGIITKERKKARFLLKHQCTGEIDEPIGVPYISCTMTALASTQS